MLLWITSLLKVHHSQMRYNLEIHIILFLLGNIYLNWQFQLFQLLPEPIVISATTDNIIFPFVLATSVTTSSTDPTHNGLTLRRRLRYWIGRKHFHLITLLIPQQFLLTHISPGSSSSDTLLLTNGAFPRPRMYLPLLDLSFVVGN